MRTRYVLVLAAASLASAGLVLAGCRAAPGPDRGATPAASASTATSASTDTSRPASATTGVAPPPSTEAPASDAKFRISYPWGVPSAEVAVNHSVHAPIGSPAEPPLPYLVGIYTGDHPEGDPAYQRISFYFRGALPSYRLHYVPRVLSEGAGTPISLSGNAFLRIGFVDAQAHDNAGASTVKVKPSNPLGYHNLHSYGFAGDFEGHLTYGLGLQVAPGSDQVLRVRAGELTKPDGAGGTFYVVFIDIQTA